MKANSYPANIRIKKRSEFVHLQEQGKKLHNRNILVIFEPTSLPESRFGIVVTRKINQRATARNRIKRRIREILRLNRSRLRSSFDILIIARRGIESCTYKEIEEQILGSLRRERCIASS